MAEISRLSDVERQFLHPYLPRTGSEGGDGMAITADKNLSRGNASSMQEDRSITRPFVTLTYASSLDSMIALAHGARTALSGPETKSMTHYLRLYHDAILVGVGTAIADDPSLSCRYPGATLETQPRPIILDPEMRWDLYNSKVCHLAIEKKSKAPWMIHTPRELTSEACWTFGSERLLVNDDGRALTSSETKTQPKVSRKIEWHSILKVLKQKGINSVMIEGGATIINDLVSQPSLVDSMVVTIAPTWLGHGGVTVSPAPKTGSDGQRINAARLQETAWRQFGDDAVLCGRLKL